MAFSFFKGKAASGDSANSAIGLESGLVKSGYLVKRAKMSQSNWKKRYFVLNGHSLTYYKDVKQVGSAQGDLLLTDDTTCQQVQEPTRGPCFDVNTPFAVLRLEATDAKERDLWMQAISKVVSELKAATRGYLWHKNTSMFEKAWSRKFFIVHDDSITSHEDHMKTSTILSAVKLSEGTVTVEFRLDCQLAVMRGGVDLMILRAAEEDERDTWAAAIKQAAKGSGAAAEEASGAAEESGETRTLLKASLEVRADSQRAKNDKWDLRYFTLTSTTLKHYESESSCKAKNATAIETFRLNPQCCVFETKMEGMSNSFELVTSKRVLHLAAANEAVAEDWIRTLRRIITQSQVTQGPLLDVVRERWACNIDGTLTGPDFYDVKFETKQPLGLVLERSCEWAMVRLSNNPDTAVTVGSVLYTINDEAVTLKTYPEIINMLTGWQPPLVLGFRHSPKKRGWLSKQSRGKNSSVKNWKTRYFVLESGRLSYYDGDTKGAEMKGNILLMGSAVTLLAHSETGQFFTFKIVGGISSIVMQAKTVDEMMDWASVLYHASSMANGGGYLLEVERDRQEKLNKVKEQAAAMRKAEEDAIAGKLAEEKARAAAESARVAEEKAKEEAAIAAANAKNEEEKAAAEAAAEEALAKAAAETARFKAEEEKAQREAEESAARAAEEEARMEAAKAEMAAVEAKAAEDAKAAEEARNKALEEQIKVEEAEIEAEEKAAEAEEQAAAAASGSDAPPVAPVARRRGSVMVNTVEDDDEDSDDETRPTEAGMTGMAHETLDQDPPEEAPAPVAPPTPAEPAPEPAPEPVAAPPAPPPVVEPVSEAPAEGAAPKDEVALTDELLESCFTNLNGGSVSGVLNPMQMSILVRLITKKHDLMQEMKWFAKFDSDGVGGIDCSEFKSGFRNIESSGLVDKVTGYDDSIKAIKSYVARSTFAL